MEFTGRYIVPACPEAVWAAINDPDVLKSCIPGCEALTRAGPASFTGTIKLKIGPMTAAFRGKVTLTELEPPRRCVLRGEGQGGVAGFARGQSEILIEPDGAGAALTYKANASVGGKLAQVGQRLVDGAARQIADEFFSRFSAAVSPVQELRAPAEIAPAQAPPAPAAPEQAARDGLSPEIWVVGLIAVIAILLLLFGVVLQ